MESDQEKPTVSSPTCTALLCGDDYVTKEEFESQYLCRFEISKEDIMIRDHVEAYLRASSGATFSESEGLARDLHKWRVSMGISNKKLNTEKMIVGGRI